MDINDTRSIPYSVVLITLIAILLITPFSPTQSEQLTAFGVCTKQHTTTPLYTEDGGYQDRGWFRDNCDIARIVAGSLEDTRICRYRSDHPDLQHFSGFELCYLISHDGTNPSADVPAPLRTS